MNAEDFYAEFKSALKYLGLTWGEMELATCKVEGGIFYVSYANKIASFQVS